MPARRSKEPGPQAHPTNYPHLSAMGVRRARAKTEIRFHDHAPTIAGTAIILQAAWLAGIYFKIIVLQELGFWPAALAPAIAIASARSLKTALGSAATSALAIPAAIVLFMLASMSIGAGIAYSRSEPTEWFTLHWQDILQKNLGSLPETWMHLMATTGPFAACGFIVKLVLDVFRR